MNIDTTEALQFVLMPFISAQLLIIVLIYITIVRKHISAYYKWYFCFIASVILFLLGRPLELFVEGRFWQSAILYARVSLLFSVGIPSLIVASAIYTGAQASKRLRLIPYVLGAVLSLGYVLLIDAQRGILFPASWLNVIVRYSLGITHYHLQIFTIIFLLVLPSCYFILKASIEKKNAKDFVIILGALIFGLLFAVGSYWDGLYWIYYVGSFIPALCWALIVFKDINELKSKVSFVKEELYSRAISGNQLDAPEVDALLEKIEHLSSNNLSIYKLRLRELLSRLTDNTIEAGGNQFDLLDRYSKKNKAIDDLKDVEALRHIARDEVVELSKMISDIPNQRVEKVKSIIESSYQDDLDIDSLALTVNVSRSYLMREFKKLTGTTVNQFLTEYRVEMAKKLLINQTVTDTAFAVGFNNSNYFSTVFKKYTGLSPIQYQQSVNS